jgi:hypothetical protein
MLFTILIVILILALVGGLPQWPYARRYDLGYFPSGIVGLLLIVALIVLLTGVARAATGTEDAQTFVIDFGPLFTLVIWPALSVVALALAGVIAAGIKKKWGVEVDKKTIETAMQAGLQLAQSKVASADITSLTVQSKIIADTANYAIAHVPDALKNMGVDVTTDAGKASLQEKIEARLAPAVMVGVSSQAPMSVAAAATIANPSVASAAAPVDDTAPTSGAKPPPKPPTWA